ncbi:transposase [Rubrivirga sp.]|uniref:transposase n=1 Tax=Rubrivirga sp. TaxID=1885344 RepID=UPI003C748D14
MSASPDSAPEGLAALLGYEWDGRAASSLSYGVVLVTRRRARLFADEKTADRIGVLLQEAATACGCRLTSCDVKPTSVRLEVEAPPTMSPHVVVTRLRRDAAGALIEEDEAIRRRVAVFTRRYLVTTGPVPDADWRAFIGGMADA